jgi:ABC-type transporter Mla MlaB component|tara:strand:+ start:193 stop:468 length:276 start_codon:yes stop_codon:yes gene_type:complete
VWVLKKSDYLTPWPTLKKYGVEAIVAGETTIDVSAWTEASTAHLAVLVLWWREAQSRGTRLNFLGLNSTFQTLAELGGVQFIETGEVDAGH